MRRVSDERNRGNQTVNDPNLQIMVAKINSVRGIKIILRYHEEKVVRGVAELISAGNFLENPAELDQQAKISRFTERMQLNERTKNATLHVSLNWDPKDLEKISGKGLSTIAGEYMKKIGFEKQPYLVYRHDDAEHPHVHIVSTFISRDGSRIRDSWIGRRLSRPACREFERVLGLVSTEQRRLTPEQAQEAGRETENLKRNHFRKSTSGGIRDVLDRVIDQYAYGSLDELNAVLRAYRVRAIACSEKSRTSQRRGLVYARLNEHGMESHMRVKSSSFDSRPTLEKLERRFKENESSLIRDSIRIRNAVDWVLVRPPATTEAFRRAMEKERVGVFFAGEG